MAPKAVILFANQRLGEGNHFDRQRKFSQHRDLFARVGDDDNLPRRRRDYFFAQERAAAALDQMQLRIEFIGSIDIDVDLLIFIERGQRNSQARS